MRREAIDLPRRPPIVVLHKRRRYASIEIDLWTTKYDLTPAGQQLARDQIHRAVSEFFERGGRGSVFFGSGATFTGVSRVLNEQADQLLAELLAIIETHAVETGADAPGDPA